MTLLAQTKAASFFARRAVRAGDYSRAVVHIQEIDRLFQELQLRGLSGGFISWSLGKRASLL